MEGSTDVAINSITSAPRTVTGAQRAGAGVGTGRRTLLVMGAWSGIAGALVTFVANALHPHPNDFQLDALLQEIAQNSAWSSIHLTLIFGLLLIFGALAAIAFTIEDEPGATLARVACLAALLGGTLILVSTAIDGFAMNRLGQAWLQAAPGEKPGALGIASAFEDAQYAIYSLSVIIFLGIGIFMYGLATVLSSSYPRALGWLAMLSGAGAFVVGVAQVFGGPDFRATEIFFVIFSMLSTVWVLTMAVLMWRKAREKETNS